MRRHLTLERFLDVTIRFRWFLVVLLATLTFLSFISISRGLQIDNSLAIWFLEDDQTYIDYQQFQREYGSDEIIIAALPLSFSQLPEGISELSELTKELEELSGVKSAFSIADAKYPLIAGKNLRWAPFYDTKRQEQQQLQLFSALEDYRAQLISEDLQHIFLYVQLEESTQIEAERGALIASVEKTITQHYDQARITGPPILNEAYNKALQQEAGLFGLLTLIIIAIVLFILLPNRRFAWVATVAVVLPTLFLFGLIAALEVKLNMISALIPTLLLVYALSDVVHILNAFNQELLVEKNPRSLSVLLARAIKKSAVPCALTTLTTIIGYFSLYFSALPALKSMGLLASLGILMAFVLAYLVIIIGLSFMTLPTANAQVGRPNTTRFDRLIYSGLMGAVQKRTALVLISSTAILCGAALLALKVEVTTDSLSLLPDSQPKEDLFFVEQRLGSSSRLQLNLTLKDSTALTYTDFLDRASLFHEKLKTNPQLGNVFSIHSVRSFLETRYARYAATSFAGPSLRAAFKEALPPQSAEVSKVFNLISSDLNTLIFTVGFAQMPTRELSALLKQIETDFNEVFAETQGVELQTNGFATVFAKLNDFVVASQLRTFALALAAILVLLTIYLRSLRRALLVILPNLVPIFSVFALMSLLNIPLGVTTAMITPIILGIAMDDTLHLTYHFLRPDASGVVQSAPVRLEGAIRYAAPALLISTISLMAGFTIIALSSTPAVSEFGLLCLAAIAIALIADLTFLPALIQRFWG